MPALNAMRSRYEQIKKPLNGSIGALTVNMGKLYNTASNLGMSLPYLSEASSGVVKTYAGNPGQQQEQIDPAKMAQRVQEAMRAAEDAQYKAQIGVNNFNQNVKFSGVQHNWANNGNPILQKGLARAQVGSDIFDLPNAVAQQIQYQAAYNQGRWNPAEMFGGRELSQMGAGMNANFDLAKQRLSRFNLENPNYFGEGLLDPYRNAQEQVQKAAQQVQTAQQRMGGYTETLDTSGRAIGFDVGAQRRNDLATAQRQYSQAQQNMSYANRYSRGRGAEAAAGMLGKGMRFVEENVKPTISNLQIKETLIK